ncbi:MAG: GNAT family N-acetyltransferase [Myxococcales bacterium]|nr:GNAT family N-acetyltransferase [Myxococcales bacterium]
MANKAPLTFRQADAADLGSIARFIGAHPHGSPEHLLVGLRSGFRSHGAILIAESEGEIAAMASYVRLELPPKEVSVANGTLEFASRSILARDSDAEHAMLRELVSRAEADGEHLILTVSAGPLRDCVEAQAIVPHFTQVIDLPQDEQTFRARLRPRLRTKLRACERAGMTIEYGSATPDALDGVAAIYDEVRQRNPNASLYPIATELLEVVSETEGVAEEFAVDVVRVVADDGRTLGAYICLALGDHAVLYRGGVADAGLRGYGGAFLMLGVVRWAIERGARLLNLGECKPRTGLFEFKASFLARYEVNDRALLQPSAAYCLSELWSQNWKVEIIANPWATRAVAAVEAMAGPPASGPLSGVAFASCTPGEHELEWARSLGLSVLAVDVPLDHHALTLVRDQQGVVVVESTRSGARTLQVVDMLTLTMPEADLAISVHRGDSAADELCASSQAADAVVIEADDEEALLGVIDVLGDEEGQVCLPEGFRPSCLPAISDECRFCGQRCPARRPRAVLVDSRGDVRACRRAAPMGKVGDPLDGMPTAENRGCEACVAQSWCSRCPVELAGPNAELFCELTRSRVMLRITALLRSARLLASRGRLSNAASVALPEALELEEPSSEVEQQLLPLLDADVGVVEIDGAAWAHSEDEVFELGETLVDVMGLLRDRASRQVAEKTLADTYDLPLTEAGELLDQSLEILAHRSLVRWHEEGDGSSSADG